jgi:two-component system, NarL family, response regulator NreC
VCLLQTRPEFEVVGEFHDGFELMEIPGDTPPDIILTDLYLPTINKTNPVVVLHQWHPNKPILVISDNLTPSHAIRALRNGALGYIVRKDEFINLVEAIFALNDGHRYVSRLVTDQILDELVDGKNFENDSDDRISSREREILQFVAEGKTNSEIGRMLVISTRTVETHRNNLMRKLGLSSQTEIIRYAYRHGLLQLDDQG